MATEITDCACVPDGLEGLSEAEHTPDINDAPSGFGRPSLSGRGSDDDRYHSSYSATPPPPPRPPTPPDTDSYGGGFQMPPSRSTPSPRSKADIAALHRSLETTSRAGNVPGCSVAFQKLLEAVGPEPITYHRLLFANVKAGDAEGALEVGKAAIQAGVGLPEESYLALVWVFADAEDISRATSVIKSMFNVGKNTRNGAVLDVPFLRHTRDAVGRVSNLAI